MLKLRLSTKIILILVIVILVPIVTMNFYLSVQMKESLQENTLSTFENIGIEIGSEIGRLVDSGRNNIVILANNPILRSENVTTSEKHEQLNLTYRYHEIYDDITLLDTEGRVITSTTYNYRGEWSANEWYKRSLNGSVVVSDAHIILNPWKVVQVFLSPVSNKNDEIDRVVAGQVDMTEIWDITDSISIGETGFVYLINNEGKIIAHPDKDLIFTKLSQNHAVNNVLQNTTGTASYTDEFGSEMICSYTPILADTIYDNNGCWGVIVAQQSDEVFASVYSFQQQQMIATTLIIIGIVLCVSLIFSRNIIKPIHKLEDGMKEIATGNLEYHVDIKSGDEMEYLATSFNKMTDDLKSLTDRVQQRTAKVEKLLKQKDDFIGQLSHDLKNPLVPITNLLPVVKKKVVDPEISKYLEIIVRNFDYMKKLVMDTLKLAKLNVPSVKMNMENTNLLEIIKNVMQNNRFMLKEKGLHVKNLVDKNIIVRADELQIEEIFNNLVSNAVKFTKQNDAIIIDATRGKDGMITVSVKDNGEGLTQEQLTYVFDEFYKVDTSRHDLGSSGLGLPICKRIVERHGGKIWAESSGVGKGSAFYFTLPTNAKMVGGSISEKIDNALSNTE